MSRLYYAFFHASVALLLSVGLDVDKISKDHGKVHSTVQGRMGKYLGMFVTNLYRIRKFCDYDAEMFVRMYGGNVEKAVYSGCAERGRHFFYKCRRIVSEARPN